MLSMCANIMGARRDGGTAGRRDGGTAGRRDGGTAGRRDGGTAGQGVLAWLGMQPMPRTPLMPLHLHLCTSASLHPYTYRPTAGEGQRCERYRRVVGLAGSGTAGVGLGGWAVPPRQGCAVTGSKHTHERVPPRMLPYVVEQLAKRNQ